MLAKRVGAYSAALFVNVAAYSLAPSWSAHAAGNDPDAVSIDIQALQKQIEQEQQQIEQQRQQIARQQRALEQLQQNVRQLQGQGGVQPAAVGRPSSSVSTRPIPSKDTSPQAQAQSGDQQGQEGTPNPQLKAAPPSASVEAIYERENALFRPGLTLTPEYTYSHSDQRTLALNGFLALGAIFLGNVNVSRIKTDVHTFNLNSVYGVTNRLQFAFNTPFLLRDSTFQSIGQNFSTAQTSEKQVANKNIGDISFGPYYQLVTEQEYVPALIVNVQGKAPTGTSPWGIKQAMDPTNTNLIFPTKLPTGTGLWAASAGVTAIKTIAPAILFGSLNYFHNFSDHFSDISTSPNMQVPGKVEPGDTIEISFGTAYALSDRMSLRLSYQGDFTTKTFLTPDNGTRQGLIGSDTSAGLLTLGTVVAIDPNFSAEVNISRGLTQDSPDLQLQLRLPYRF